MPVKFQSHSEYNQQFQYGMDQSDPPLPDFYKPPTHQKKSSQKHGVTYEPPLQHKKKATSGMEHLPHKYMCLEPPLQRKKKPIQPHGSKPTALSAEGQEASYSGEEYVLLGSQKKFAPNIIYKAKPVYVSQEVGKPVDEEVSTPMAPRPNPPPNVVVDTGAPKYKRKLDKQLDNTRQQNRDSKNQFQDAAQQNGSNARPQNRDLTNGEHNAMPQKKYSIKQQHKSSLQNKDLYKSTTKQESANLDNYHHGVKQKTKNADWSATKKSPIKPNPSEAEPKFREKATVTKFEENVQNGEQAQSDYAMKYKAGIAPPRGQGPKRLSEYQRQFAWKQGVGSSPLLDAEQVVYKSSSQIIPRKARFNKTTEYRREFQPWQSSVEPVFAKPNTQKVQRSKSVDALTPDKREPAGKEKVTSEIDPRLVQESLNPVKPYFPHGPFRSYSSEYAANFAPPQVYEYEKGTWKGANPPHLQADKAREKEMKPKKKASKSQTSEGIPKPTSFKDTSDDNGPSRPNSWFMEVIELRKRADEYKRRAQGTHFSRQHLVQLLAEQAELWDTASTSSVLSALSLEHPHVERSQRVAARRKSSASKDLTNAPPAGKKTAWGNDREPASSRATDESARSASIITTFDTQSVQNDLSEAPTLPDEGGSVQMSSGATTPTGRIPTPNMPAPGLRHHLDRTTPLQGGALLSSPPRNGAPSANTGRRIRSASTDSVSSVPVMQKESKQPSANARKDNSQTSQSVNKLVKPLYGMPTRDTHVLVDETASVDRPLVTDYVDTPIKHARHNRDKFPEVDVPSTIQENTADTRVSKFGSRAGTKSKSQNEVTLGDIPQRLPEDDILSMSMRSVASSCSLASEVLERAKTRRDEFWGVSGRA